MHYGVNADLIIGAEVHFGQIRQGKGRESLGWFFNNKLWYTGAFPKT